MHPRRVYKLLAMVDPGPVNMHHIVNAFSATKETDEGLLHSIDLLLDGKFIEVDDDNKLLITESGRNLRRGIKQGLDA